MHKPEIPPRRASHRGLTFLELLVASAMLAIIAVGVAGALVQGPRVSRAAREEMAVRASIRAMVSELTAAPYSEMAKSYEKTGFDVTGLAAVKGDADGLPGSIAIDPIDESGGKYYRVTFSVNWHGVQGDRSISSVHYIANARGDTALPSDPASTGGSDSTDPNVDPGETVPGDTGTVTDPNDPNYDPRLDPKSDQYDPTLDPSSPYYDPSKVDVK